MTQGSTMKKFMVAFFIFTLPSVFASDLAVEAMLENSTLHKCNKPQQQRHRRSFYSTRHTAHPLHCPPCEQIHCYRYRKEKLDCKGGYTVGVCGCCRVCAKIENEQCGGDHNYLGRCDRGLFCEPQPPTEVTFLKDGVETKYKIYKGICRKAPKRLSNTHDNCKPKCEPNYCNKNPRAICSAKNNADNSNHCESKCQHTSCRACRFVRPVRPCPKCAPDDFKCLREFGRCFRKNTCQPKRYPCGNERAAKKAKEEFLCAIPECA